MNVSDNLKIIYSGPFSRYLTLSRKLEDLIREQSKLVNSLFKLHMNLLQILQKYKKPLHQQQEDIFTDPIPKQIELIKKFTSENQYEYLHFISDFVEIFWWMKQTQKEKFLDDINNKIILYRNQLEGDALSMDSIHSNWLHAWIETLEEFSSLILLNFKQGLSWTGSDNLPAHVVVGDLASNCRNFNQQALLKEINQEEDIRRVLRHRDDNEAGVSSARE
ncbi:hypothetical protein JTB14_032141 [Gonioctena quinquepunctata]|nr:hypothetical protein JTB14_032141 [Gonioctena quinquepunctata]